MQLEEANHITTDAYIKEFFETLQEAYVDVKDAIGEEHAKLGMQRVAQGLFDKYVECLQSKQISRTRFRELMSLFHKYSQSQIETGGTLVRDENPLHPIARAADLAPKIDPKKYRANGLIIPGDLDDMPSLKCGNGRFVAPKTIDLRDYCIETRDQGELPWCAAFTAVGFASNVIWRKTDYPTAFDPSTYYRYAKEIDGSPGQDGTTLVAVLKALLHYKVFDPEICSVKVLRSEDQVRYAIHKFGCCLLGMFITKEWYNCSQNNMAICGKSDREDVGGHAVLCCGYTRDGVIIQNSWSSNWGSYGFALITWEEFRREFSYGAVLDNCLNDMRIN